MNFTLFATVLLTGILFVALVVYQANLMAPRSFNKQKLEAYECGIPTRGSSWAQFNVGYYLFAILFLMFDVETMFLFPWATIATDLGPGARIAELYFLVILVLGLAYAWRKGALTWK